MADVMFTLRSGLSGKQTDDALGRIRANRSIRSAGPVNPQSTSAFTSRFSKAVVDDPSQVNSVVAFLKTLPEVEYAELPPQRTLIQPVPNPMVAH